MAKLNPTLLIGLGGTGIDVLRRFKTFHVQTTSPEDRAHIRLLGIDTIQQTTEGYELLAPEEFVHLAPIGITNKTIERYADMPQLRWSKAGLPAFTVGQGTGQKRLAGYVAYLWDGAEVRQRIEAAIHHLKSPEVTNHFRGMEQYATTRVFVVSSVCGGTGTGMFLDVTYLAREAFRRLGLDARFLGMLFLPSAFPELMANRFVARGCGPMGSRRSKS